MKQLKDWLLAILIVGGIVMCLYAAWILAIVAAISAFIFIVKSIVEVVRE